VRRTHGTTESSIVDSARARPGLLLVVLLGGLLLVDLAAKLAGFSILPRSARRSRSIGSARTSGTGVVIGLVIGLAGIGLSMTYSILSFANFSHGDLLSTGAFTGWGVAFLIAGFGDIPVRALLTVGDAGSATPGDIRAHPPRRRSRYSSAARGLCGHRRRRAGARPRVLQKPMRDRDGISILIASIGAALIVRYVIQFVYGSDRRGVTAAIDASNLAFDPLGLSVNAHELTIVVAAIGLMLSRCTSCSSARSSAPRCGRWADNKDLALVTGIPAERVVTATWIIGGGLAGASGYLYVLLRGTIQFDFGWLLLL